ncbi:MAG: glycosyltransferase family protein [Gemmatimonadaceae bacterium]
MAATAGVSQAAPALPRILLVTDADLTVGSRGAGRTLVNLFSRYPAVSLLAVSGSAHASYQMQSGSRVLAGAPGVPGRLVDRLRGVLGDVDALAARWKPLADAAAIRAFAPQLVVAAPTHPVGIALAERCAAMSPGVPVVTYLMDDWLAHRDSAQFAFDTPRRGRALLRASRGWLVISRYLLESMRSGTGIERPAHVVHNPVALSGGEPAALAAPRRGRYRVAYAGSVWPMHWDAVAAVAASVARLRAAGEDVEFVLFTDRFFWGRHKADWQRWGVVDGGLLPYAELGAALGECDLLLVASSFDPSQAHMTRSSVQTKVTDYMAAGRPILGCGPRDAASNRFLREHECACFAEDPAPDAVDSALRACVAARGEGPALARRAWEVVRQEHEIGAVTDALYEFLRRMADGEQRTA